MDMVELAGQRLARLRSVMAEHDTAALFTADPINIAYATGVRNMTIYSMMGAVRFMLVTVDGPLILWDFAGTEHLAQDNVNVTEVRTAPGVTALSGPDYLADAGRLAAQVADACAAQAASRPKVAVERVDHQVTDAFRAAGLELSDATTLFVRARLVNLPDEIDVMCAAVARVMDGVEVVQSQLEPGRTEIEVWADFQRHLIATGGEYVSTRLVQSGPPALTD